MKALLNQTKITDLLTYADANILPGTDAVVDLVAEFENETVKSVFDTLLLVSNSVLYLDGDTIKVKNRNFAATSTHTFYGQASNDGIENIDKISKIKNGVARVINLLKWEDTGISSNDQTSGENFGIRKKDIKVDGITTNATRQTILDNIRDEFKDSKQEFELKTEMNYTTLLLAELDKVTVDYPPIPFTVEGNLALIDIAIIDVDQIAGIVSNFEINKVDYGIMGFKINMQTESITFSLREA